MPTPLAEKLRGKLGREPTGAELEAERARKRKKREEKAAAASQEPAGGEGADSGEAPPAKKQRAPQKCGKCGQIKKGHTCTFALVPAGDGTDGAADGAGGQKARKGKAPGGLKRPQSAYMLYINQKRAKVKADNPSASMIEVTKILAQKWNSLSDERKSKYNAQAAEKKAEYEQAKAALPPAPPPAAAPAAAGAGGSSPSLAQMQAAVKAAHRSAAAAVKAVEAVAQANGGDSDLRDAADSQARAAAAAAAARAGGAAAAGRKAAAGGAAAVGR